ncbi:DUF938 domain-containing protein [Sphingobium phenoxybenzoativorans]|uniref:DUF938 domain-containing protein n=2 Tax=Sphingobium phenoxybenzoativorans TaxID=1592790 RepID=A0A975KBC6_9SPHN|nr:DUF938 domain-containing protein [Sphingobium phenoxybenzoativorans]QUT08286.1 DUF938 domain-containing protein [Sphingobium phenoxybenzoativorans]
MAETGAGSEADKRYAPATLRNRDAIVEVLRAILPDRGLVLEVASGSGEHAVHFARAFPALDWQPSDPDPAALASIAAWSGEAGLSNLRSPLKIDASTGIWQVDRADAVLCINMIHISPWAATAGLMRGAGAVLPPGGVLYLYGPFIRTGVPTAPSNMDFDQSLRERDPAWGLRDLDAVIGIATEAGLACVTVVDMPANNLSVMFRRK